MKSYAIPATVIVALLMYSPLFAADPAVQQGPQGAQARGAELQAGSDSANMDAHFVKEAAQDNMLEVKLAELAEQRATNDQIKQLAKKIREDHTQANQKLQQIAQSKNIEWPRELDPLHSAVLNHFQEMQGKHSRNTISTAR